MQDKKTIENLMNVFDAEAAKFGFGYPDVKTLSAQLVPDIYINVLQFETKSDIYIYMDTMMVKYDFVNQMYLKYKIKYDEMTRRIKQLESKIYIKLAAGKPFMIDGVWYAKAAKKSDNGKPAEIGDKTVTLVDLTDTSIKSYAFQIAEAEVNSSSDYTYHRLLMYVNSFKAMVSLLWKLIETGTNVMMSMSNDNKVNATMNSSRNRSSYDADYAFANTLK